MKLGKNCFGSYVGVFCRAPLDPPTNTTDTSGSHQDDLYRRISSRSSRPDCSRQRSEPVARRHAQLRRRRSIVVGGCAGRDAAGGVGAVICDQVDAGIDIPMDGEISRENYFLPPPSPGRISLITTRRALRDCVQCGCANLLPNCAQEHFLRRFRARARMHERPVK